MKTLLQEMKDGVFVCDPAGTIHLYNRAAEFLFAGNPSVGTGRSLYDFCFQPPVDRALSLLRYQHGLGNHTVPLNFVQFMNASTSQEQFFRCRASLLPEPHDQDNSFVIVFEDISAWQIPDNPLFMKIEGFRAPMTNLRAAVENLTEYPDMSPVMRSAFENVLVQEALNLTDAFNSLAGSCSIIMQNLNHLTELDTELLFGYVTSHLQSKKINVTAFPEQGVGVKTDIYGLLLVLDYLAGKILRQQKGMSLSSEIRIGEQFVYFDYIWSGPFITTAALKKMLEKKPAHSVGQMTVASILHAMDGDIWSQQLDNANRLRLALPIAIEGGKIT